ncbi:MAG: alpha/beta hydrolase [Candidatus Latescibacterota bacterium]|jgi:alpha-beta hydrolase superfamily lysophospholipase|nr:MAG: alpha/beta hydrolase [Candidatus Latescibacterota bacterium]
MTHEEGIVRGAGGVELYCRRWRPERESRAALAIVHGHGEHGGRYMNVVDALLPAGCAVCAFDHRGHGRSRGQRGHIGAWAEYRDDVKAFLRWVAEREPRRPVFLMGHSMGALVVLDYVLHDPRGLAGAIVSGAPIEPAGVAKPSLVLLSRALSRACGRFPMRLALDVSALSRDAAVVRAYAEDPLVHGTFTARWGTESLSALERVKARAAGVSLPILFIHGEADRLNLPGGIRDYFEKTGSPDKTLLVYPGMYHELHNDVGRETVMSDLVRWIERRL